MGPLSRDVRAFIAIDPPATVKDFLGTLSRELQRSDANVKWVRPESIHITLKFLGEISFDCIPQLEQILPSVFSSQLPIQLSVRGIGSFPERSRPRVIWAGLVDPSENLRSLAAAVDRVLEPLGFSREKRPFSPHLTLGRVQSHSGVKGLIERVQQRAEVSGPSFVADHAILFRSDLKPTGAVYSVLSRFPFHRD